MELYRVGFGFEEDTNVENELSMRLNVRKWEESWYVKFDVCKEFLYVVEEDLELMWKILIAEFGKEYTSFFEELLWDEIGGEFCSWIDGVFRRLVIFLLVILFSWA